MNKPTIATYISVKDAAQMIGVSPWTLYKMIKEDPTFPAINVGRKKKYVVHLERLNLWLGRAERKIVVLAPLAPSSEELIERFAQ